METGEKPPKNRKKPVGQRILKAQQHMNERLDEMDVEIESMKSVREIEN